MNRKLTFLLTLTTAALLFSGCGSSGKKDSDKNDSAGNIVIDKDDEPTSAPQEETPTVTDPPEEISKDGYVRSELTNEWIVEELADSRPLSMMVPNNKSALPHYGLSRAGVIYECLAEGKISRLLCVWDDWRDMERIGNIRSARAYYVYWALEWDSILCHFGNPYHADYILGIKACDHIDGNKSPYGFFRVKNEGRVYEQTAYASTEDLLKACDYYKISLTHTDYHNDDHWQFANSSSPVILSQTHSDAIDCTYVNCRSAFPDDKPYFEYHADDKLYYRFEFGDKHMDAAYNEQLAFTNIIVQYCDYIVLDAKGYLTYDVINTGIGYYITGGELIPISWQKTGETTPTVFRDAQGTEITFNTGKTMVLVVGTDCTVTFEP